MQIAKSWLPSVLSVFGMVAVLATNGFAETRLDSYLRKVEFALKKYDDLAVAARNAAILESMAREMSPLSTSASQAVRLSVFWHPISLKIRDYAERFDQLVTSKTAAIGEDFVERTASGLHAFSEVFAIQTPSPSAIADETMSLSQADAASIFGSSVIPRDVSVALEHGLTNSEIWNEVRTLAIGRYSVPGLQQRSPAFDESWNVADRFSSKPDDSISFN